jgi:hypothetical protein
MRYLTPTLIILLLASLIANGVMYAKFRSHRAIMTVNGVGISKFDMDTYLEQNYSPQYKALMTQRILFHQEAEKDNLTAKDSEVDYNYNLAKEQDYNFASQMRMNPWLADETKNKIRQQIEMNRVLIKDIPVSEDEIKEEYQKNSLKYDTPRKARTELAVIYRTTAHKDEIVQLMSKTDPPVKASSIMDNYRGEVAFLGENNIFTFTQPFGADKVNATIFSMKPGEVKELPVSPEFSAQGVLKMIVRMREIIPGKKADLKDPRTLESIRYNVAIKRSKPASETLERLWDNMKFDSEDPNDKTYIEALLLPEKYRREKDKSK